MVCTGMRTNVSFVKSMQQTWTILPHDGPDRLTNMADMRTGIRSNVSFPDWCADQRSSQLSLRRLCCTDYTADLPDECAPHPPLLSPPSSQRIEADAFGQFSGASSLHQTGPREGPLKNADVHFSGDFLTAKGGGTKKHHHH